MGNIPIKKIGKVPMHVPVVFSDLETIQKIKKEILSV